jgi:prepilin-type N-terminal cleavage/methylation domain-containing protein
MIPPQRITRLGFSLLELVVVVAILAALAGLVLLNTGSIQDKASYATTKTTLDAIRDAIAGTATAQGYQQDMRELPGAQAILSLPGTLQSLYVAPTGASVYSPLTRLGWHGPYLKGDSGVYQINTNTGFTASYGANGDSAPLDAWNHPIVIQIPAADPTYARLVSAGPDGVIQTPLNYLDSNGKPYPPASMRGDDVVLFLLRPDGPSSQ